MIKKYFSLPLLALCATLSNASTLFAMQRYGHRNGDDAGINRTRLKLSTLLDTCKQDLQNNPLSRPHQRQKNLAAWALSDFESEIQKRSYKAALDYTYEAAEPLFHGTDSQFINGLRYALSKPLDTDTN